MNFQPGRANAEETGVVTPLSEATTALLRKVQERDSGAAEELLPRIYGELHRIAARHMQKEGASHTLQTTALIHEAWVKMTDPQAPPAWENQAQFLRLASRAMRNVLVDHARRKSTLKRGERAQVDAGALERMADTFEEHRVDVIELDQALEELGASEPRLARLVELRFFGGLSVPETARVLGLSVSSIEREWRRARAWFRRRLPDTEAGGR